MDRKTRRSILKTSGIALAGTALTTSVSANGQNGEFPDELDEDDLDDEDLEDLRKLEDGELGSRSPDDDEISLSSETISPLSTSDVNTENLTYIDSLEDGGEIESDQTGITLGYSDHFLHFYRGDETDDNGNYLYYFVFYTQGDPRTIAGVNHLEHEIELDDSDWNITEFAPDSTVGDDCQTTTLEVGLEYEGVGMSAATDIEVCTGELSPHSGISLNEWGFEWTTPTWGHGGWGTNQYAKGVAHFRADELLGEFDLQTSIDWDPYAEMISA
ncbi:hypothetical protein RBH26_19140 [Natronolimnohabitans sp. A-GB9]|uniref:hypothetical protein n=1 Tax=Natronolimnohabitans sp. A-GB9 TaxID=3069757 RepID=UPI0027AE7E63|nr:hypothetical protein [Natronolimnohabitans sp. A-GB9]MDQ2052578.1 hypothetical protein [Natronolimnohabitans sp. A-GB9]